MQTSDNTNFSFVLFCILSILFAALTYYVKLMYQKDIDKELKKQQEIELDLKDAISTKITYVQDDSNQLIDI